MVIDDQSRKFEPSFTIMKSLNYLLLTLSCSASLLAQEKHVPQQDPHHHRHPIRIAVLMGHGMVPEIDGGVLFVPAWGWDLDYHLSDRWSLGLHSDVELENYIILNGQGEEVLLRTPLVSTIDAFYRLNHNLIVGAGPGFTAENGEWKPIVRVGVEGEVPMNDRWEWTPTLYMDQRMEGRRVLTFALGVAHYL